VYTHPATADCCRNLLPGVPDTVIEFGTDTSRTITDIVFSGTADRCRDAQFIFSHAGGTLPFLTERLVRLPVQNPAMQARVPRGVLTELKRFFYDTAWSAHPMALASLTRLVPTSQILFGSDYPYRTGEDHVKGLMEYGFTAADRRAIDRDNALRLLPRLSAYRLVNSIYSIYLQAGTRPIELTARRIAVTPQQWRSSLQFGPFFVLQFLRTSVERSRQTGPFVDARGVWCSQASCHVHDCFGWAPACSSWFSRLARGSRSD